MFGAEGGGGPPARGCGCTSGSASARRDPSRCRWLPTLPAGDTVDPTRFRPAPPWPHLLPRRSPLVVSPPPDRLRRRRAPRGSGDLLRDEILDAATELLLDTGHAKAVSIR